MKRVHIVITALGGLRANKARSLLTILGIVIGITAIILIASIGKSAEQLITGQLTSLGANIAIVIPGKEPSGPADPHAAETLLSDSLGQRELDALERKTNVPTLSFAMPVVFGVETASYRGETFQPMVMGASERIAFIFDLTPDEGSFFTATDVRTRASDVVIGSAVKEELFGLDTAIGKRIMVNNHALRVVGVLPPTGQVLFFNADKTIFTPYTVAQQYLFGIRHFNRIILEVADAVHRDQTVRDTEATLRALHNITNTENDDFFVSTPEQVSDILGTVIGAVTAFLVAVAAIALVVGGVGIMNIMLVSVTERTQEIGLRKALGASRRDILKQFLAEAILLTFFGGAIGIGFGSLLAFIASLVLTVIMGIDWVFSVPVAATLIGLAVSVGIGIVFGVYPARTAARKDPMEALRYE